MVWYLAIFGATMKILDKTIKRAYKLWQPDPLVRCFHVACAFDIINLLSAPIIIL